MCNAKRLCELLTTVFFLLRFSLPPSRLFRADVSLCTLNARVTFANALFLYAPYIRITASKHRRVCNCGQHELIELNNTRKTKATPGPEYQQQILFFFFHFSFFLFLSAKYRRKCDGDGFCCCLSCALMLNFYTFLFAVSQLIDTEVRYIIRATL